ncbi:MAG: VOC family protein [Pirellulaceae bacterium]|nr:VOC family protein [Pirellulaceae bacterium]
MVFLVIPFPIPQAIMQLTAIMETCLYVNDLAAAISFYEKVLGLPCVQQEASRHAFFQCGSQMLLLFLPEVSSATSSDVPPHGSRGPGHVAFQIKPEELTHWQQHLAQNGIPIEQHVPWPHGGNSLYFRDPAGNSLELVSTDVWGLGQTSDDA